MSLFKGIPQRQCALFVLSIIIALFCTIYISSANSDNNSHSSLLSSSVGTSPQSQCYQVQHPNPNGTTYDMLDWMTMDEDLRNTSHLTGSHNTYTVVWPDKIYYLKTTQGDTWDINLYDNNYIYQWITETAWNMPYNYKKSAHNTNIVMTPRFTSGGYPGTKIVSCDSSYYYCVNCTNCNTYNLQKVIHEIWGPYLQYLGGNLGYQQILIDKYYWNCTGDDSSTCSELEENWYANRYGWERWTPYSKNSSGQWYQPQPPSIFNQLVEGTTSPFFPCF